MRLILFTWLLFLNGVQTQNKSTVSSTGKTGTVVKIMDGDTFDLVTKKREEKYPSPHEWH